MKLNIAIFIFLIGFFNNTFAEKSSRNLLDKSTHSESILSVLLYLPLSDNAAWSSMMAQSQLTVTPTATYTVRAINIIDWDTQNGTCNSQYATHNIDNGVGNTVTLSSGQVSAS